MFPDGFAKLLPTFSFVESDPAAFTELGQVKSITGSTRLHQSMGLKHPASLKGTSSFHTETASKHMFISYNLYDWQFQEAVAAHSKRLPGSKMLNLK